MAKYLQQNYCLQNRRGEDFINPEEYYPILNGQFLSFVQTLNLAFMLLFDSIRLFADWEQEGVIRGARGSDKLTEGAWPKRFLL